MADSYVLWVRRVGDLKYVGLGSLTGIRSLERGSWLFIVLAKRMGFHYFKI